MAILHGTPDMSYLSRREFLRRTGGGCGLLALASLASAESHHPAKAKSIIWLFLNGGPSQVDTFDYKPSLEKYDGKELPGFDKNTGFFVNDVGGLMKSPF